MIIGSLADFVAFAFAPQSMITPLGSLTLVANVVFAPRLLGETIDSRDLIATVIIIIGSTMSVAFADHVTPVHSHEKLFSFFFRTRFMIYLIVIILLIFSFWAILQYCEFMFEKFGAYSHEYQKVVKIHRFLYAAISGTIGAQNVLFAKTAVELLVDSFHGNGFLFLM